jgi:hypothetical protein
MQIPDQEAPIGSGAGSEPIATPSTQRQFGQKNMLMPKDLSCAYAEIVISRLQWGQIGTIEFIVGDPPKTCDMMGP